MEGGYLPWKNKSKEVSNQVEALSKPLPPPPIGKEWEKLSSGEWQLRDKLQLEHVDSTTFSEQEGVLEHTVMPSDTLQGLCLRYGCSAVELRRLNMFSGNSIQFKKTLLIPVSQGVKFIPQDQTEDITLQKFRNITGECISESRVYLADANYNIDVAVQNWRTDESWESGQYLKQIKTSILSGYKCAEGEVDVYKQEGICTKKLVFSSIDGSRIVAPVAIRTPTVTAPSRVKIVETASYSSSIH
mmetsp:Transcript_99414/g.195295  ORF Transcript_99414/g.195295 Transcript_99414/m.195295 type:complete len:244 (-) Transcript_99414:116-847(-)